MFQTTTQEFRPLDALRRANLALALGMIVTWAITYIETLMETHLGIESFFLSTLSEPWRYWSRAALLWMLPAGGFYWLLRRLPTPQWMHVGLVVHTCLLLAHLSVVLYLVLLTAVAMGSDISFTLRNHVRDAWGIAMCTGLLALVCRALHGVGNLKSSQPG